MSKVLNSKEFDELVLKGQGKILVDFYADWCGPCRMLGPVMDEIGKENTVYKINVDDEGEIAQKYGIMSIPCVICFENGEAIKKTVGLQSKDEILELLK